MSQDENLPALWPSRRFGESLGRLGAIASRLPGAQNVQELLDVMEQRLLAELKDRLERTPTPAASLGQVPEDEHPGRLLAGLLERQSGQSQASARASLYHALLKDIVPDEASLLAALADGSSYAMLHVGYGRTVATQQILARNFSTVAQQSSVRLRDEVPAYITRLRRLGLVEEGPEDKRLEIKYQILEGSVAVQRLSAELKKQGKSPRTIRRVLRASPLGLALWSYCEPDKYLSA